MRSSPSPRVKCTGLEPMTAPQAVLCIDFDGTLTNPQMCLHPRDIDVLKDFPPAIQPVITTGRDLRSLKSILKENGLVENSPFSFPGVFLNGGMACLPGEVICQKHTLSPETQNTLIDLARDFPKSTFTYFSLDTIYLVNPTPFGQDIAQAHHLMPSITVIDCLPVLNGGLPDEIIKVMILEPETELMEKIKARVQDLDVESAMSLPFSCEVNPQGIDKAASLLELLKTIQLDHLPIYAAGDAENDLGLFKLARTSFAPTTAHPKVVEVADRLIPREKDGLLTPLLRYLSIMINNA